MKRENLDTLQAIALRRSYRKKYKSNPVPREDLRLIMEAGLAAPSGCNLQITELVAVDDPALLAQIRENAGQLPIQTTSAIICVLTRKVIAYRDVTFHVHDYSAAIENMLIAITAMGYASCWYEGEITEDNNLGRKVADLIGVPPEYSLVCMLPIGVPDEGMSTPAKRAFEERAWFNGYKKE